MQNRNVFIGALAATLIAPLSSFSDTYTWVGEGAGHPLQEVALREGPSVCSLPARQNASGRGRAAQCRSERRAERPC